ncbi:unnamed protein product [Phytophthora fragariaefolia]|uniref:Unnamed protein product n=1 Tax=Phytophthora fragariaefolia TaxID=1490495 RepID=A0A9W6TJA2_9STRA|nr:unnamed protein product [Phytophthora fragariaefolia]
MFRPGAMMESEAGVVRIEDHSPEMVSKMLEFIYTNRVADLGKLNSNVRTTKIPYVLATLSADPVLCLSCCPATDRSTDTVGTVPADTTETSL